jgi:hypothetical protein
MAATILQRMLEPQAFVSRPIAEWISCLLFAWRKWLLDVRPGGRLPYGFTEVVRTDSVGLPSR